MTADPTIRPLLDPHALAEEARSALSCPAAVSLVVDGVPAAGHEPGLGIQEDHGTPTFVCVPGSALAASAGRDAVLTVRSGLPAPGSADGVTVSVTGRLAARGTEACACCAEERVVLALEPRAVLLDRGEGAAVDGSRRVRVPVVEFRSPAHDLNRGFLRRSAAHAGECHQDALRRSVATSTGAPLGQVLGASLGELTTTGVTLTWLDPRGSHQRRIVFCRPARSAAELSDLLRRELDTGFC